MSFCSTYLTPHIGKQGNCYVGTSLQALEACFGEMFSEGFWQNSGGSPSKEHFPEIGRHWFLLHPKWSYVLATSHGGQQGSCYVDTSLQALGACISMLS